MRILYIHQYFVPPNGSGGTRSLEFARRLVGAGHEVTMITSDAFFPARVSRESETVEWIDGIEVRILRVPYSNRMSYTRRLVAFSAFLLKTVRAVLRQGSCDVVFATSTPLTVAVPAIVAKLRFDKPMVFEVRDLWPELPVAIGALRSPTLIWLARWLERAAYRSSARVVALSPGMAQGVVATGYPSERVSIIPNSCDSYLRADEGEVQRFLDGHPYLAGGPLVSYAGTIGPINGVEYLVRMAAAMQQVDPTVRFLVAGGGREAERVRDQARATGVLGENLWMIPPQPKSTISGLLGASTVCTSLFVDLPPMWNNCANKFFDGLAAGRPVMINYRGWQAELLERSGAGLVVPPGDPEEAARRLGRFVSDAVVVQRAASAAARLGEQHFDRDMLAARLLGLLEEVCADAA